MKTSDLENYYYGDRLVQAENIPYQYKAMMWFNDYAITWAYYYPIPCIEKDYSNIEELFINLINIPYVENQNNPNLIFSNGGNCQAFSIYMRTALNKMGCLNGFLPLPNHVCNWVVIDNILYKIDVVSKEFAQISAKERAYLESSIPELTELCQEE